MCTNITRRAIPYLIQAHKRPRTRLTGQNACKHVHLTPRTQTKKTNSLRWHKPQVHVFHWAVRKTSNTHFFFRLLIILTTKNCIGRTPLLHEVKQSPLTHKISTT